MRQMLLKFKILLLILLSFSYTLLAQEDVQMTTEPYIVALYKNAGNEFKIISPAITWKDSIKYNCSGATVFTNQNDHRVITLMPYAPTVLLSIYRDSTLIGTKKFKVRLIPKPTFNLYSDHSLITSIDSIHSTISKGTIDLTVKAIPDEFLAKDLPQDARYAVKHWVISLVRERKVIDSLSFTDETGNIQRLLSQFKTGYLLHVEIKKVHRTNFLNQKEIVHLPITIKIITIE